MDPYHRVYHLIIHSHNCHLSGWKSLILDNDQCIRASHSSSEHIEKARASRILIQRQDLRQLDLTRIKVYHVLLTDGVQKNIRCVKLRGGHGGAYSQ